MLKIASCASFIISRGGEDMPSTSKKQKQFFALALAYKRGHVTDVSDKVKQVASDLTEEQLKHYLVLEEKESVKDE